MPVQKMAQPKAGRRTFKVMSIEDEARAFSNKAAQDEGDAEAPQLSKIEQFKARRLASGDEVEEPAAKKPAETVEEPSQSEPEAPIAKNVEVDVASTTTTPASAEEENRGEGGEGSKPVV